VTSPVQENPLKRLVQEIPVELLSTVPEVGIRGIASDSRRVQPGDLFVAVQGELSDGHQYIGSAVERGAAAVLGTQDVRDVGAPYVRVSDSRRALPFLAAGIYGFPARKMTVIGVTGTDGKTTTSNLIYHILKAASLPVGMISTVNALIGDMALDTGFHVTTPDPIDVQRYLAEMVSAGLSHVILEATSHGLAQYRVDACEFDIAVVTNITHEHLDYHGSYEAYRAAKARLFTGLAETFPKEFKPPRAAVLNRDDESYQFLASLSPVRTVTYGYHPEADVRAEEVQVGSNALRFVAAVPGYRFPVTTRMGGLFNVSNCLAAIAAAVVVMRISPEHAQQGLSQMLGVQGRMERVELGQKFTAIVDFAHTPNALRAALESARLITNEAARPGRVISVFGSAGLRDLAKRRMMAETSARMADLTILTAEDPRTEPLDDILADMAAGAQAGGGTEGATFWRVPDRGEAIRFAVSQAQPGDVVISCGKGHEQSMCFGAIEYAWDDLTAMKAALCELLQIAGPKMPYLPTQDDAQE
jgi:UDP-N-acetylmuramoyl-L-alanyl-D-glutamate--2,6-diaminopimelate ligase